MLYAEHLRFTVPYCLTAPTQLLFPAQRDRDRLKMQHTSGRSGTGAERVYLIHLHIGSSLVLVCGVMHVCMLQLLPQSREKLTGTAA